MRIIKKTKIKVFLRTAYITSVIIFCLGFGFYGISKAYENIRLVNYGEYRSAIEIQDGKFKFFDYEFYIPSF